MEQKNKNLLLRDLCSRLPYGVILNCCNSIGEKLTSISENGLINHDYDIDEVKPYLFPLSSMTEEQLNELKEYSGLKYSASLLELNTWTDECTTLEFWLEETPSYVVIKVFDWLNEHHFDYRNLIDKNLAIDCTNLNIY